MALRVRITTGPDIKEALDKVIAFSADYRRKAQQTHKKWVYKVLVYTQMYSRVDTGRSRAAWTPLMIKDGYPFQQWAIPGEHEDPAKVALGQSEGTFDDQPFNTIINNNVSYVEPMNRRYGLFGFAPSGTRLPANILRERGRHRDKLFGVNEYGNRVTMGIRFEEKVPLFEEYGKEVFTQFIDASKQAFEAGGNLAPTQIETPDIVPPVSP